MSRRKKSIKTALSQTDCAISSVEIVMDYVESSYDCSLNPYCVDCKRTQCYFYQHYGNNKLCLLSKTLDRLKIFETYLEGLIG